MLIIEFTKNKNGPNELKFCEDSRNPKSIRISAFYLEKQKSFVPKKKYAAC